MSELETTPVAPLSPSAPSTPKTSQRSSFRVAAVTVRTSVALSQAVNKEGANGRHQRIFKEVLKKKCNGVAQAWCLDICNGGRQALDQGDFLNALRNSGIEDLLKLKGSGGKLVWNELMSSLSSEVLSLKDLDPVAASLLETFKECAMKYSSLDALWRDGFLMDVIKKNAQCKLQGFIAGCARMGITENTQANSIFEHLDSSGTKAITIDALEWMGLPREDKVQQSEEETQVTQLKNVKTKSETTKKIAVNIKVPDKLNLSKLRPIRLLSKEANKGACGNMTSTAGSVQTLFANFWGNFWALAGQYNAAAKYYKQAEEHLHDGLALVPVDMPFQPFFKGRQENEARKLNQSNLGIVRQNLSLVQGRAKNDDPKKMPQEDRPKKMPQKPDGPKPSMPSRPARPMSRSSVTKAAQKNNSEGRKLKEKMDGGKTPKPQPYK